VSERPPELSVPRPDEAAPADEMAMGRAWLAHLRETARHVGHMDITRELLDGRTGR
jgi:hypothetical protein